MNKATRRRFLQLGNGSYLTDDLGNQHNLFPIWFATERAAEEFDPEFSVDFSFSASDMNRKATSISVVIEYLFGAKGEPTTWNHKVGFRNVSLLEK